MSCYNCNNFNSEDAPDNAPVVLVRQGSSFNCAVCSTELIRDGNVLVQHESDDYEPTGPDDFSDDGDALASAGFGTDEDYGYYGDD